jgi:hypothetical protein
VTKKNKSMGIVYKEFFFGVTLPRKFLGKSHKDSMENYMKYKGSNAPFTKLAIVKFLSPCELVKLVWFELD